MTQIIDEEITVACHFDPKKKQARPTSFYWRNREYLVEKLGLYHQYREGRTVMHVFGIIANDLYFRLEFSGSDLVWKLAELNDGQPD